MQSYSTEGIENDWTTAVQAETVSVRSILL